MTHDTTVTVQQNIEDFSCYFLFDCEVNKNKAIYDIRYDKPKLFISGGIAPVVYSGQEKFEEKHGITYHDYGCISPEYNCMLEYNQTIFEYLDQAYGKSWRKEVRKDVVGMKRRLAKRNN